jgi:hypothetical protein
MFVCLTLLMGASACKERSSKGHLWVDDATREAWEAGERAEAEAGRQITPIPAAKNSEDSVPVEYLKTQIPNIRASNRHGARDKRLLSDTTGKRSSGILAEIALVKGSETKSEKDFRIGWIPIAMVFRPPTPGLQDTTYTKLGLTKAETSWVFVREVDSVKWVGSLVHGENATYKQTPLKVSTVSVSISPSGKVDTMAIDSLEPVKGARFVWQENDETMWAYCGGKCCSMRGFK